MPGYASTTSVSVDRSKAEIEALISRHGATQFLTGWDDSGRAMVAFNCQSRMIRFVIEMPSADEKRFTHTEGRNQRRSPTQAREAYEQEVKAQWRRLLLCIKAKFESLVSGIETFDEAFLAQIVLPNNQTVGDWAAGQIPEAVKSRLMPPRLLALPAAEPK